VVEKRRRKSFPLSAQGDDPPRRRCDIVPAVKRHLFVCTNARNSGKPACGAGGSDELLAAVQTELIRRSSDACATACACLGPCFDGPNAVVYPDGVWYAHLTVADAVRLADHLIDGAVLDDRRVPAPGD
jgi:(2Fe-2S) ferredoxin